MSLRGDTTASYVAGLGGLALAIFAAPSLRAPILATLGTLQLFGGIGIVVMAVRVLFEGGGLGWRLKRTKASSS